MERLFNSFNFVFAPPLKITCLKNLGTVLRCRSKISFNFFCVPLRQFLVIYSILTTLNIVIIINLTTTIYSSPTSLIRSLANVSTKRLESLWRDMQMKIPWMTEIPILLLLFGGGCGGGAVDGGGGNEDTRWRPEFQADSRQHARRSSPRPPHRMSLVFWFGISVCPCCGYTTIKLLPS